MNPTPEQMAFAFAMLSLRSRDRDTYGEQDSSELWSSVFRIATIVVIGLTTGLMALSYLETRVATGGRTAAEIGAISDPSPNFHGGDARGDRLTSLAETASAR